MGAKDPRNRYPQRLPGEGPYHGFTKLGFPISKREAPAYGYDDDGKPVHAYNAEGDATCGRKIKNQDRICQSTVRSGTGRCSAPGHGGSVAARKGAPIKHGLRSQALRNLHLAKKFETVLGDPELTSHRENIAMIEVLITETLEGSQPPATVWQAAIDLHAEAITGSLRALAQLGELLCDGKANAERIDQAVDLAEKQRKHKQSEAKRENDLQSTMDARQANAFVMALASVVMEKFSDLMDRVEAGLTRQDLMAARLWIAKEIAGRMS